jgi:hypothetical protein
MANAANPTKVITGKVRLSYAFLFEARKRGDSDDQTAKYSTALLIPKHTAEGKETYRKLRAAQQAALEEGKAKLGGIPKKWKDTIHDGDEDQDLDSNPEYAGHWYLTVSNSRKPGLIDRDRDPITEPSELYSGCYARVSMNAYAYNYEGTKGVTFSLRNVQKLADGEPLGGVNVAPEDDFDDDLPADEDDDIL